MKRLVPSELNPALNTLLVTDDAGLDRVEDYLKRTFVFGFDTETNVVDDFVERRIRTIQLGDRNEQYVIDLLAFAGSKEALIAGQGFGGSAASDLLFGRIIRILRVALESTKWLKIGTGLQFDYEVLRWCLGIRMTGVHDLQRTEQNIYAGIIPVIFKGIDFWGLDSIVGRYLGLEISKDEQKTFDLETPITFNQLVYCGLDVRLPVSCYGAQMQLVSHEKLEKAVRIDCDAISSFGDMHLTGMLCSEEKWRGLIDDNLKKKRLIVAAMDRYMIPVVGSKEVRQSEVDHMNNLETLWRESPQRTAEDKEARKIARANYMKVRVLLNARLKASEKCEGCAAINYSSTHQLTPAIKKLLKVGDKKLPDTSDDTLEKLATIKDLTVEKAFENWGQVDYSFIDLLRLYRIVDKQLDTYGYDWVTSRAEGGLVNPYTGRIHPKINLFGADTGRTTSSSPNSQNLPKSKRFRNCFVARPGYKIITIDMSGAELRIMAEMSGDPVWLEAFKKGWDVHSVGAEILYGEKWKAGTEPGCKYYEQHDGRDHQKCKCKIHEELRGKVKAVNFGIAYGKGPYALALDLGITKDEAIDLLARYKAAFPVVMKWLEETCIKAKTRLIVYSMEGGRRRWKKPEWEDSKKKVNEEKLKTHRRLATQEEIRKHYSGRFAAIGREGMNAGVQRTNAYIAKRAMSLIWEKLEPVYGGYYINFVHDEVVVEVPESNAQECAEFLAQCFLEAGREFFKVIDMESEYQIKDFWTK